MDEFFQNMWWSQYPCGPQVGYPPQPPPDKYRTGGRTYGGLDCTPFYGGMNPCSEVDMNWPPGLGDCRYGWAGAMCYVLVAKALQYAGYNKVTYGSGGCPSLKNLIIELGIGEESDRQHVVPGDLIFIDYIPPIDDYGDHVAVITSITDDWENDCSIGIIGFYGDPFNYTVSEVRNWQFNLVLDEEWGPYYAYDFPPGGWWFTRDGCKYIHIFNLQ